jgi:hypothetical protein
MRTRGFFVVRGEGHPLACFLFVVEPAPHVGAGVSADALDGLRIVDRDVTVFDEGQVGYRVISADAVCNGLLVPGRAATPSL